MVYRKNRRFSRHRSNGRTHSHSLRRNGGGPARMGSNSFSNQNRSRNNFRVPQNVEKLVEKYNALAKEALSTGDRTLSENYLQHADHFSRILSSQEILKENNLNSQKINENIPEDNKNPEASS